MLTSKEIEELRDQLDGVLARFGADMSRWPQEDLALLRWVIENDVDAKARFAEAEAFDRLIAHAPSTSPSTDLKNRILDAARGDTGHEAAVIDFPVKTGGETRTQSWTQILPVSGLLAASLVLGIFIGATEQTNNSIATLFGVTNGTVLASNDQEIELALSLPSLSFESSVVLSEDFDEQ